MIFKPLGLILLVLHCVLANIEIEDLDNKLDELSNEFKQFRKEFSNQVKSNDKAIQDLNLEENFMLSVLTGHQKNLKIKVNKISNIQDTIKQTQEQTKQSQEDMKKSQEDVKKSQEDITKSQEDIKKSLEDMKKSEEDMKKSQEDIKKSQEDMKKSQEDMKKSQEVMKKSQEDMKTSQEQTKKMQDEDHKKIKEMFDIINLTHEIALINLKKHVINGKTYFFISRNHKSWDDADKFCKSHGLRLISVDIKEDWIALKPKIKETFGKISWPWSSGRYFAQEGTWKWTSKASDYVFTFFDGEHNISNDSDKNCLILYDDGWSNAPCSSTSAFICEQNN